MSKVANKKTNYYLRIFHHNRLLLSFNILFVLIVSAGQAVIALLLKNIIDITVSGDRNRFLKSLLLSLGYMVLFALFCYISSLLSKMLMRNVIRRLRNSIFHGITRRNYQDFYEVNSAEYLSVLTNDIKMVEENYIQPLSSTIENIVSFLFTLVMLIFISPIVTLFLFVCFLLMVIIPGIIGQKLQGKQEIVSGGYSDFTTKMKDLFLGYEVIRSFHLFRFIKDQFQIENDALASKKYQADKLFVLNETMSQSLAFFSQIITIFIGAYLVIKGNITVGSLIAIMQLAGSFVMPLVMVMQNFPKIQSVAPVLKRMEQFDDYIDTSFPGKLKPHFENSIKIEEVSFAYKKNQPVLRDISLEFMKGKKYAIVGESGCGKSTLVKLIMGYYNNFKGDITYDKMSLKDCDVSEISELASMIHQNVYMFDRSILDNICLFKDYSMEEIQKAVEVSGVEKFLPAMQENLETMGGENGINLSGGQRQRIAIARALIKGTPILILDEATAALDQQTANDIERNLLSKKDLTIITVTHKLDEELLGKYDQIIYMENGNVVECGSYTELYGAKKSFYQFCVA